jgi:hypothetical protein
MFRLSSLFVIALFVTETLGAASPKEFRRTVGLSANGRVELVSERGTAHITTWDRHEVEVFARIEARPESQDPEESVRRTEIRFDATSDSVRIRTDFGERIWAGSWLGLNRDPAPLVHYEIKVPRSADLTISDNRSKIEVGDLQGRLRLHTDRSSIQVSSLNGALSVEADRGTIRIGQLILREAGTFHTDRTEVELGIAPNYGMTLDLDLERVSPSIDSGLVPGFVEKDKRRVTYRGAIGPGGPTLRFIADRGSLRLRRA